MDVICKESNYSSTEEKTDTLSREDEIITCAFCNMHITDPSRQIRVNNSFHHVFANPHGRVFEIGCFSHANGCSSASTPSFEFSWFAGYSWKIGICKYCSTHLGWIFSSSADKFYGLILEKLNFP